jgi:hypothetical protein
MDRTVTKTANRFRVCIALGALALLGPGCSRMRTYRAQNSPMPGLPVLGRFSRGTEKPRAELADRARTPRRGDVAWSGNPNTAAPLARLAPPPEPSPGSVPPSPARPVQTPPALAEAPKADNPSIAKLRSLVQAGRESLAKIATYQVAMTRQERVGESLLPAEDVLLSIRREPKSIRLEWPEGAHKGREVLYSAAAGDGMMHINMADSVLPLPKMTLPPDSPMVMKNSRHPITEAGLDAIVDRLDESLKPHETGGANGETLTYDGLVTPPESGRPCHKITRTTAKGETWVIHLDAASCIPNFVQEVAANGELLERYSFRDLTIDPPSLADASAFDPEKRWGGGRGILGRMARGAGTANPATR